MLNDFNIYIFYPLYYTISLTLLIKYANFQSYNCHEGDHG